MSEVHFCVRHGEANCIHPACVDPALNLHPPVPHIRKTYVEDFKAANPTPSFFDKVKAVTEERGKSYGSPKTGFQRAALLKAVVGDCKDPLARHVLEMLCVKIARLIETPSHADSWLDVAGYAWTGNEVTKS